jgi:hypothetical protein
MALCCCGVQRERCLAKTLLLFCYQFRAEFRLTRADFRSYAYFSISFLFSQAFGISEHSTEMGLGQKRQLAWNGRPIAWLFQTEVAPAGGEAGGSAAADRHRDGHVHRKYNMNNIRRLSSPLVIARSHF